MRIGEFAQMAGVSARALRHYETARLLVPARTSGGYRDYTAEDLDTVERIRLILGTGLGVAAARRYLDCVHAGSGEATVTMCPNLRRELSELEDRLRRRSERIAGERAAIARFVASSRSEGV